MAVTDTQRAYGLIKEKIVTTEMAPGAVIHEAALMSNLGLGRTPIREALKLLEGERLVTVSPRRGMFVTTINLSDLGQIQEVRSVLDLLCVRLAAARMTPDELAVLRSTVQEFQAVAAGRDMKRLMALDERFHRLLAEATRNELLQSEIEMLYNLSQRIWFYYLDRLNPADLAFDALVEVVDTLEANDNQRAERAMARHIRHFGDSIKHHL